MAESDPFSEPGLKLVRIGVFPPEKYPTCGPNAFKGCASQRLGANTAVLPSGEDVISIIKGKFPCVCYTSPRSRFIERKTEFIPVTPTASEIAEQEALKQREAGLEEQLRFETDLETNPERIQSIQKDLRVLRAKIERPVALPRFRERTVSEARTEWLLPVTRCFTGGITLNTHRQKLRKIEEGYRDFQREIVKRWGRFVKITDEEKKRDESLRKDASKYKAKLHEHAPLILDGCEIERERPMKPSLGYPHEFMTEEELILPGGK